MIEKSHSKLRFLNICLSIVALFCASRTFANTFETSYLKIDLPNQWECQGKSKTWICQSKDPKEKKEGFFTIKAKLSSSRDTVGNFLKALQKPKTLVGKSKKVSLSKVYSVGKSNYNGYDWVQSLHLGSVLPRYFTQYFVTTKGDLTISFEMNYHQSVYKKYADIAEKMANSLQIKDNIATTATRVALPAATPDFPTSPKTYDLTETTAASPVLSQQLVIIVAAALMLIFGLALYFRRS